MPSLASTNRLPRPHEIAILGNDVLLAALPARPVQVMHALQACGYELVVPVSWGEEVLAQHALRVLGASTDAPRVFAACPRARARILRSGSDIAPAMISTVAPPAATALYLRALQPDVAVRITYFGSCEGARHPSIDARVAPEDLLRHLTGSGIPLQGQPTVFEGVVPPDRRRHLSRPGGLPAGEHVAASPPAFRLATLEGLDLTAELADLLLAGDRVLVDAVEAVGCSCAGGGGSGFRTCAEGRAAIAAIEPPTSPTPVIDVALEPNLPLAIGPPGGGAQGSATPAPARDERLPSGTEGIHPIDGARRRAERRRFAVTPASTVTVQSHRPDAPAAPLAPVGGDRIALPKTTASDPDGPRGDSGIPAAVAAVGHDVIVVAVPEPELPQPGTEQPPEGPAAILESSATNTTGATARRSERTRWSLARRTRFRHTGSATRSMPRAYAAQGSASGHVRRPPAEGGVAGAPRPEGSALTTPDATAEGGDPAPVAGPADAAASAGADAPSMPTPTSPIEPRNAGVASATPAVSLPAHADQNEYVTVKERMALRRLHSRPRRPRPAHSGGRPGSGHLVTWLLAILAVAFAVVAVVAR